MKNKELIALLSMFGTEVEIQSINFESSNVKITFKSEKSPVQTVTFTEDIPSD